MLELHLYICLCLYRSYIMRCVFGCNHGKTLHQFPNPIKFPERFEVWRKAVGQHASSLSDSEIKRRLRVCDLHFIDEHRVRYKRLSALAVPCRNLPGTSYVKIKTIGECDKMKEEPSNHEDRTGPSVFKNEITGGCDALKEKPLDLNHDHSDIDLSRIEVTTQTAPMDNTRVGSRDKSSPGTKADDGLLSPDTPVVPYARSNYDRILSASCPNASKHDYFLNERVKKNSNRCRNEYKYKPHMGAYYHNQWLLQRKEMRYQSILLSQLRRTIRVLRKSSETLRMSDEWAWNRVTRNMTGPAKLFLSIDMKSKKWNKYTMEEKALVISIYKKSPGCYNLLCNYFNLPSIARLGDSTLKISEIS